MELSAIQLVDHNSLNNCITFDEDTLRDFLTCEKIKNSYVAIISINGPSRQGKSFLLNFFLRYLQIKYKEKRDVTQWLTPREGPLKGFSWASGSKRHTTGIMMWPEIFQTNLENGEKVSIILLDSQGSFDKRSSMGECAKIFALSTLISSTQIYNLMRDIKQYDLSHLQCFGGYGSLFTDCNTTPFQNLCFLIRDWSFPDEHAYGEAGGQAFLEDMFASDQPDMKEQVENVENLFQKIDCFLLPHPGHEVATSSKFDGSLEEIDDNFKQQVKDLTEKLLSPENLVLKTINGEKVKAGDLMYYITEYSRVLKSGTLPEVQTFFKATVEAQHKAAHVKAMKYFKKWMDMEVKHHHSYLTAHDLNKTYMVNKGKTIKHFHEIKKSQDQDILDRYLEQLKNDVDAQFKHYCQINEENKKKYEETKRKMDEQIRRSVKASQQRSQPGSSMHLDELFSPQNVGTAVAAVGGIAALAFGAAKLFGSRGNND